MTLLFARGHYSIDVLIAYWMTTRLWWIYHTLANNPTLVLKDNKYNYMSQFWWFCIFKHFEGKVGRPIPKGFNWPLPKRLRWRPSWPTSSSSTSSPRRRHQNGNESTIENPDDPALVVAAQRSPPTTTPLTQHQYTREWSAIRTTNQMTNYRLDRLNKNVLPSPCAKRFGKGKPTKKIESS